MRSFFKSRILWVAVVLIGAIGLGGGVYYVSTEHGPIYEYRETRDLAAIEKLFDANRYMLTANPNSSIAFFLKYRTPDINPLHLGRLQVKVLRDQDDLIGFTAYWMKRNDLGKVLFIAVDSKYRGKRYGEKLMQYAINDLKSRGAKRITLVTRPTNHSAIALYRRVGFKEMRRNDEYVFFEYMVK